MPGPPSRFTDRRIPDVSILKSLSPFADWIDRHQWIFITDTVDAIYRPDECFPEAMMDQLAEIVGALPVGDSRVRSERQYFCHGLIDTATFQDLPSGNGTSPTAHISSFKNQRPMRRPLLNSVRQIESIRDLVPFFSSVSIASYESVYASAGNVDWEDVEKGLMDDMFDGR